MRIAVLYFAALREALGIAEESVELPEVECTIDAVAGHLSERHPALLPHLTSVRFALNETFVSGEARVSEGDTVALIPPVSGG